MCYFYFQNSDYYRPPFALDILTYQTTKRPDDACDTSKDETEDRRQNPTKPFSNNKADVQYTQSELPPVAPYSYNYNSDVLYENSCYVVGSTGNADGVETKAVSVCCMLPLHGDVYVCVVA